MTHKDSDGFLCIPVQLLKIVAALSDVSRLWGQNSTLHCFVYWTEFSVLSKNKKKATVVPKEAPMLAMKALELRKK